MNLLVANLLFPNLPVANLFAGYDMLIVLAVVFLLFGNRLPSVMRNLGKGVTEFKKGVAGIEDQSEERSTT
ncbi:MAG TPA: twin-arginine translocase TatA/TatE family subunit [Pirellulales bacterium]|nr:twin-arginine translocase TatA/TatE family subunit [Pirellulales bacterium]